MDKRLDPRYPASLEVRMTNLKDQTQVARGFVSDISKTGICVTSPACFAPGTLVTLDVADSALYGYVVYSRSEQTIFRTGIEVERVLLGGTDLSKLLHGVLQQEMPHVPGLEFAIP